MNDLHAPTVPLLDAAEGTVPLVAGAAAGTAADATPADDAGASATPSYDTAGKKWGPVTAASAGAAAAATVLYRRRRGSVARTVSHDNYDYRCRTTAADSIGTVAVVTTAVLRQGPRDITAGATAATAVWKLQGISSGATTRFRATENGAKRTTEIPFTLVAPVLSRKGDTVSSVACLLHSSMVAAIRCSQWP